MRARTIEVAENVMQLYYDVRVPLGAAELLLPRETRPRLLAFQAMSDALNQLDLRDPGSDEFYKSVDAAREYMKREYYDKLCDKGAGGNRQLRRPYSYRRGVAVGFGADPP